jgi:hypothetical protein
MDEFPRSCWLRLIGERQLDFLQHHEKQ